MKTIWGQHCHS